MFEPHLYAVFGYPILHSKSPEVHRAFASLTKQDLIYTKQEVLPEDFKEVCSEFFELGGQGLNITLPLKELAYNYATKLTERARLAGAVNTLKLESTGEGSVLGDNTDGAGLVRDITQNLKWPIKNKRILLLGAGGAVRGVLGPLLQEEPEIICIANRTASKATVLANAFKKLGNVYGCGFDQMPQEKFDLIINGTSMSLSGGVPPITRAQLLKQTCAYDMAYGSSPTPFIVWAKEQGLTNTSDGLGMLVEQAAESFQLWRGVMPNTESVISMLRDNL
ncbi:MAG: shikimate dehydrogenase [Cellvibrionaceae bacterium]